MMLSCYFCSEQMEYFEPDRIRYTNHWVCRHCPEVAETEFNTELGSIWSCPYFVFVKHNEIVRSFLYFRQINVWLKYDTGGPIDRITLYSSQIIEIFSLEQTLDVVNISPSILENKVKTWILFS